MSLGAYVDVDFDGEANETLRVKVPAPEDAEIGSQVFVGEPMSLPWGEKLRFLSVGAVIEEAGTLYMSTDRSLQPGSGFTKASSGGDLDLIPDLLSEFETRASAAFFFEQGAEWTLLSGGFSSFGYDVGFANSVFYATIADQFVYLPKADNWKGRVVLPIPKDSPITIIERDVATGWIINQSDVETALFDNDLTEVEFPSGPIRPPMLIDASPFEVIRFRPPPLDATDALKLGIEATTKEKGKVEIRPVPEFAPGKGESLMVFDVTGTFPQVDTIRKPPVERLAPFTICDESEAWNKNMKSGEDMMLVVGPGDLNPNEFEAFEFLFDRSLHESMKDAEPETIAQLYDLGPISQCGSSSAENTIPVRIELTNHNSRLVVRPTSTLPAGHRFKLRLVPPNIVTYREEEVPPISYYGTAPKYFIFATRRIPGEVIAEYPSSDVVDMLKFGNILVGGTLEGKLIAVDVSKPTTGSFEGLAEYSGNAGQIRALATDGHNRLFFGARFGGSWGVKTVRVEDIRETSDGTFEPVEGGVTFGYALGTNSGVSASEYLALSVLPSGTPVDMEVMVHDDIGESLELRDFYEEYTGNDFFDQVTGPVADARGIYTFTISLDATTIDYPRDRHCREECAYDRYQRVTVDNLTTGQTWSHDIESPWDSCPGTPGSEEFEISARFGDVLRVRHNINALGYIAFLGSGVSVVDLNRFYRNLRPVGSAVGAGQCYRRVAKYEGEDLELECREGAGLQFGLDLIPSLAVHGETGCGPDGCDRGADNIHIYIPRTYEGLVTASSPIRRPDKISAPFPVQCLQKIKVEKVGDGTDDDAYRQLSVTLRDTALANDARWFDNGVAVRLDGTSFVYREVDPGAPPVEGDLLFVSLGRAGIFVFDVSKRPSTQPWPIGHLYVEGHQIHRLQVDPTRGLLFAGGYDDATGSLVDVWDIRYVNAAPDIPCAEGVSDCPESVGASPRPIATLDDFAWTTNHLGVDATGIGLLYSWNRGETIGARPIASPEFVFGGLYLTGESEEGEATKQDFESRPTDLLAPLGIPLERSLANEHDPAKVEENEREYTAAFKLRVALPGSLGEEVTATVQSLRELPDLAFLGRPDIGNFESLPGGPGWPDTEVEVTMVRIGDAGTVPGGRYDTVYNLYESRETVLVMADPRATREYTRQDLKEGELAETADEEAQCRNCEWPSYLPSPDTEDQSELAELENIKELLAGGRYIRAFLTPATTAAEYFAAQGDNYRPPASAIEVGGWADFVPSAIQASQAEPVLNPALWSPGEGGISVSLSSGELIHSSVDHAVPGRKLGFSFGRSYRSGAIGYGPLGSVGWTADLFAHLRFMRVTGEVEYHDGSGNVYRFLPKDGDKGAESIPEGYEDDSVGKYLVPEGLYLRLSNLPGAAGWRLTDINNNVLQFDERGRLTEIRDRIRRSSRARDARGNTVSLRYNLVGELVEVIDDYGRSYSFNYDDDPSSSSYGLLEGFEDFLSTPRTVEYRYDDDRRLTDVVLPSVTNKTSAYSQYSYPEPTIFYEYSDKEFGDSAPSNGEHFSRLRLKGFKPPGSGVLRFEAGYDDHGRVDEVAFPEINIWELAWKPKEVAAPTETVGVTAPWGQVSEYSLDKFGRAASVSALGVPTLGPGSSKPGPDAEGIPKRDLKTSFEYFDRSKDGPWKDGRLDRVTHPDGSYRTSLYRDVGDRLAGATLLSIEQHQGMARDGFQINGHIYDSVQTEFFYDAEHGGVDNLPGAVSDGLGRLQRFAIPEGVDVTNPIPEPKTYGFEADGVVGTMQPTTHGRTSHIKDGFGTFSTGGEKAKNGTDATSSPG